MPLPGWTQGRRLTALEQVWGLSASTWRARPTAGACSSLRCQTHAKPPVHNGIRLRVGGAQHFHDSQSPSHTEEPPERRRSWRKGGKGLAASWRESISRHCFRPTDWTTPILSSHEEVSYRQQANNSACLSHIANFIFIWDMSVGPQIPPTKLYQ